MRGFVCGSFPAHASKQSYAELVISRLNLLITGDMLNLLRYALKDFFVLLASLLLHSPKIGSRRLLAVYCYLIALDADSYDFLYLRLDALVGMFDAPAILILDFPAILLAHTRNSDCRLFVPSVFWLVVLLVLLHSLCQIGI